MSSERIYLFQLEGNTFAWGTNADDIHKYFEEFRKNGSGKFYTYETKIDLVATIYNFKLIEK